MCGGEGAIEGVWGLSGTSCDVFDYHYAREEEEGRKRRGVGREHKVEEVVSYWTGGVGRRGSD